MDILTKETNAQDVSNFINTFFRYYFIEKNIDKLLPMVTDDFCFFLPSEAYSGHTKYSFQKMLPIEYKTLPSFSDFQVLDYHESHQEESNTWNVFCTIKKFFIDDFQNSSTISSYITIAIVRKKEQYFVSNLHITEADGIYNMNQQLGLEFAPGTVHHLNKQNRYELIKVLSSMIPVGIVGVFLDELFSLFSINDKMLEMLGYTYKEYLAATDGFFGKFIHKDDLYIIHTILEKVELDNQYEAEYRLQKKDGSYIWVYDIGRKIITDDGKEAIICGLIDITQRVEAKNDLYNETLIDDLTKTYNRKGAKVLLNEKLKTVSSYAFLLMDIDHFKAVNDLYGHSIGDQMLTFISNILINSFLTKDVIIRLGGDEFAIFVNSCSDPELLKEKLTKISQKYKEKVAQLCPNSYSTLSFGGIITQRKLTFEELYLKADKILYEVKYKYKGNSKIQSI